jgi:ABC-type glycerol-3-phosphate transport system permease component
MATTNDRAERWMRWIALSTTALAVLAAIATLRNGSFSTRMQLATTEEANAWSYFQSKSIKQHATENQRDMLKLQRLVSAPQHRDSIGRMIMTCETDIARYDREKTEIQDQAVAFDKNQGLLKRRTNSLGTSVMFFQIGIVLSSFAAQLKRETLWFLGLGAGAVGLVYFVNGLVLFLPI